MFAEMITGHAVITGAEDKAISEICLDTFSFDSVDFNPQPSDTDCDLMDPYLEATLDNTFPVFHPRLFFSRLKTISHENNESTESKQLVSGAYLMVSTVSQLLLFSKNMLITKSVALFLVHINKY